MNGEAISSDVVVAVLGRRLGGSTQTNRRSRHTNARTTHATGTRVFACREPLLCHHRRRSARSTGWHTPEGEGFADELGNAEEAEHTPCAAHARFDDYKYVLTMQCAERSLHDACAKERIAGLRVAEIRDAVRSVAACLGALHARGVCHGDCKQRNVVRLGGRWVLCDMDAAARVGERIGEKTSTAYCPPELARWRFTGATGGEVGQEAAEARGARGEEGQPEPLLELVTESAPEPEPELELEPENEPAPAPAPDSEPAPATAPAPTPTPAPALSPAWLSVARPSFDVWSLGVVLFELCAGHALFRQDTSNDELVEDTDRTRLCTWHTVGEQQLGLVRS